MEVVKLDSGYISGTVLGDPDKPVYVYRGIPYAAPPVGDLRWKPPQPVTPWSGIRECTAFSAAAPQSVTGHYPKSTMPQSEDCLYLNVLTPMKNDSEKMPVMVWMHGGSFSFWSGTDTLYNGFRLPLNGIVLVNVNMRLGPLGLLCHPMLSRESPKGVSGNYTFLDLIATLQWVQKNIPAFGGDPDSVTIFGESSGAAAAVRLIASTLVKGLFHRAIIESGVGPAFTRSLKDAEAIGEKVFTKLGVDNKSDSLMAARNMSWQKIIEAGQTVSAEINLPFGLWNSVEDGWFLPDTQATIFSTGRQNRIPFIVGYNSGEVAGWPPGSIPASVDLLSAGNKAGVKTYAYIFDHVPAGWQRDGVPSHHTFEIPYIFGEWKDWNRHVDFWPILYNFARNTGAKSDDPGFTNADNRVSELMMKMWTNFAKTGNPSIEGVVDWPSWDEDKDQYLYITESPEVK
ncbi:MAG: hypothetical protein A2158_05590 [Chloroflexi bacterium RBG_13_46_14]|nr:MAG: hypothetical protein A2158_05590 [Chloroflexi bacterium RBG_13_46_14]